MLRHFLCAALLACAPALAGDAREDWARLTALDAGPAVVPKTAREALATALGHLDRQEKSLRAFLEAHPSDSNIFEARIRLARLLDLRANLQDEPEPAEVATVLQDAEILATTPARRAEFDFLILSRRLRRWHAKRPTADERQDILGQARSFARAHPGDRRIAALLAEVAVLFDGEPKTKESLLLDAKKLAVNPELKAQIADDLRRLGFFGKPLKLRFTALDGQSVDTKNWEGKVVAVIFFATSSEPSKAGFAELQRAVAQAGRDAVFIAISLDPERAALDEFIRRLKTPCPVAWDGRSWDGQLMRALGINAVPTAWLLDRRGILRSMDALDDPAGQIQRLMESR